MLNKNSSASKTTASAAMIELTCNIVLLVGMVLLLSTSLSPSLASAESKSDLSAVESFIHEERPTVLSQALYVPIPKGSHGQYQEFIPASSMRNPATINPLSPLFEKRIREIFVTTDKANTPNTNSPRVESAIREKFRNQSNTDDSEVFTVQRTPDGKLSVVYNNTQITPTFTGISGYGYDYEPATNHQSQVWNDVIFPTEKPSKSGVGMKPKCAQGNKLFCTQVENYPTAQIASILLAEREKYEQLFGDDLVVPGNLTQRIDASDEESLCPCNERVIYPESGITKDNVEMFIINQRDFTQGIRIEECMNAGQPCSNIILPNGYTSECKQNFIYRQLLSYTPDKGVIKDFFKIPSCCKCVLKHSLRGRRDINHRKAQNVK